MCYYNTNSIYTNGRKKFFFSFFSNLWTYNKRKILINLLSIYTGKWNSWYLIFRFFDLDKKRNIKFNTKLKKNNISNKQ